MKHGDLLTVAMPGDFGKTRPAGVVPSDPFRETATATVLRRAGTRLEAPPIRLQIDPTPENRRRRRSQIRIDKPMTVKQDKPGTPFGRIDREAARAVHHATALFPGGA
jgi:mRNA interferase MazF